MRREPEGSRNMSKGRLWGVVVVLAGLTLFLAASPGPANPGGKQAASSADGGFALCEGPYALCTTALCTPVPGQSGLVTCKCSVQNGYSVGMNCQGPKDTPAGKQISSRYFLTRSYVPCNNSRPWAWCL